MIFGPVDASDVWSSTYMSGITLRAHGLLYYYGIVARITQLRMVALIND